MGLLLAAAGLFSAFPALALKRPDMSRHEHDVLGEVHRAIEARDCPRAIARLNAGLAEKFPDIYIMAGSMYEQGLCLTANWERAERMYQLARAAGHEAGALRLIAGYAHQRRDPASALWWGSRSEQNVVPGFCRVADGSNDPDAFVAALRTWPAGRLAQCTYVVGVLAAIAAETEYPSMALDYAMSANLSMRFLPSAGKVEWTTVDVTLEPLPGVVDGDYMRDRSARAIQNSFRTYLVGVSDSVLKRFQQPEGIAAAWEVQQQYQFTMRFR